MTGAGGLVLCDSYIGFLYHLHLDSHDLSLNMAEKMAVMGTNAPA